MVKSIIDIGRVKISVHCDHVASVTLTRSNKLNSLDPLMFDALIESGKQLSTIAGLRCVVLSGEGRGFCAGLDLKSVADSKNLNGEMLEKRAYGNANKFQQVAMLWRMLPVPVIAAVHGVCFGGGLQVVAGADICIVSPDARLAIMEMKWGLIPDMGGCALWRGRVRDDILRELTYTNREFNGAQALDYGFATIVDDDPLARAISLAHEIASRSPTAIRAAKSLFNKLQELSMDEILIAESIAQKNLLGSENQLEAVRSQLDNRKGNFFDPQPGQLHSEIQRC